MAKLNPPIFILLAAFILGGTGCGMPDNSCDCLEQYTQLLSELDQAELTLPLNAEKSPKWKKIDQKLIQLAAHCRDVMSGDHCADSLIPFAEKRNFDPFPYQERYAQLSQYPPQEGLFPLKPEDFSWVNGQVILADPNTHDSKSGDVITISLKHYSQKKLKILLGWNNSIFRLVFGKDTLWTGSHQWGEAHRNREIEFGELDTFGITTKTSFPMFRDNFRDFEKLYSEGTLQVKLPLNGGDSVWQNVPKSPEYFFAIREGQHWLKPDSSQFHVPLPDRRYFIDEDLIEFKVPTP